MSSSPMLEDDNNQKSSTASTAAAAAAATDADISNTKAVVLCDECEDAPALMACGACEDRFCALCYSWLHRSGKRREHEPTALDGTPLARAVKERTLEGTTEHFVAQLKSDEQNQSVPSVQKPTKSNDNSDAAATDKERTVEDEARAQFYSQLIQTVPLRLTAEERALFKLLEGALKVSEYTDRVDVSSSVYGGMSYGFSFYGGGGGTNVSKKLRIMQRELGEVFSLLSGMVVVQDYNAGKRLVKKSFEENADFFQKIFEIGRRFKIMNPDKMRTTYGKLMHILQDAVSPKVLENGINVVVPIQTVGRLLRKRRGTRALLSDVDLPTAIEALESQVGGDREAFGKALAKKKAARARLLERYAGPNGTCVQTSDEDEDLMAPTKKLKPAPNMLNSVKGLFGYGPEKSDSDLFEDSSGNDNLSLSNKPPLSVAELERVLDSLADAESHKLSSVSPVKHMLECLETYFHPTEYDTKTCLRISSGSNGTKFSHSHRQQYQFVRQSLMLWQEIQSQMFRLWLCADADMLSPAGYRLMNTGQGLNRVSAAPKVSKAMAEILGKVKRSVGHHWVGLSVVHLGDRDVPNALFFIDKYTQVPRILSPISRTMKAIPTLLKNPKTKPFLDYNVDADARAQDPVLATRVRILRSFFRLGFNGDGDDGGSCIDGRLTSAWNWCSKIESKVFWNTFQLCGFTSFDGDFKP